MKREREELLDLKRDLINLVLWNCGSGPGDETRIHGSRLPEAPPRPLVQRPQAVSGAPPLPAASGFRLPEVVTVGQCPLPDP